MTATPPAVPAPADTAPPGLSPAVPGADPTHRPRDRAATRERILGAVGAVLARDGFARLGINAIAREAGVDKVLIYRYFGGLPELLRTWGSSGRFWPRVSDLLGDDPRAVLDLPEHERFARFLEHFIDALRARPLTLEILAAELQERNELTAILEAEREAWGEEAARVLGGPAYASQPHLAAVTVVLVAGVQYLMLRARRLRLFGGLDLHTDAAWDEIKQALRALAVQLVVAPEPSPLSPSR
ncbi:MAG: TetR/AcrR family transcriptional regulator [Ideonella sp.]|nr:TetR/AcrR family transcriptional regulator [Ideonella sp.]